MKKGAILEQLYHLSLHLHMMFVVLLIVSQLAFFGIKKETNFILLVQRFKLLFLIQNILLGAVIFTGLLMLAVTKFSLWNIEIVLMIVLATALVVHQILIYKKMRPITSKERDAQKRWIAYASKIYGAEVVGEVLLYLLALLIG